MTKRPRKQALSSCSYYDETPSNDETEMPFRLSNFNATGPERVPPKSFAKMFLILFKILPLTKVGLK